MILVTRQTESNTLPPAQPQRSDRRNWLQCVSVFTSTPSSSDQCLAAVRNRNTDLWLYTHTRQHLLCLVFEPARRSTWHDRVSAMTSCHGLPPFVMSLQCDSICQDRLSITQRPCSLKAVVVVVASVVAVLFRSSARQTSTEAGDLQWLQRTSRWGK